MNLYVGNLPFSTSESDLSEMFGQYGEVASTQIIMDKMTGRSRGFGFVEMPDGSAAQAAIDGLNGKDMGGRPLTVNEAKPKTMSGGGGGGRSRGYDR